MVPLRHANDSLLIGVPRSIVRAGWKNQPGISPNAARATLTANANSHELHREARAATQILSLFYTQTTPVDVSLTTFYSG